MTSESGTHTFRFATREDTLAWGRALGGLLRAGDVVALLGDLGAGKTTLTQGIAQGMNIADRVTSPTFTLVQEYGRALPLFHFDPYRLESAEDAEGFGFDEYLQRDGVVVVEWADRITTLLPNDKLLIRLMIEDSGSAFTDETASEDAARLMQVEAHGPRFTSLLNDLLAALQADTNLRAEPS